MATNHPPSPLTMAPSTPYARSSRPPCPQKRKPRSAPLFLNSEDDLPIRTTLEELGHPQLPTPMQVYNTTAVGFANNIIKKKRSKSIDMSFYWIRDHTRQGPFNIYWAPGITNIGDYHTKHHSPIHHCLMRPRFLHDEPHVQLSNLFVMHLLRGCVNSRKMHALCAEPDINSRRHITAVKIF